MTVPLAAQTEEGPDTGMTPLAAVAQAAETNMHNDNNRHNNINSNRHKNNNNVHSNGRNRHDRHNNEHNKWRIIGELRKS